MTILKKMNFLLFAGFGSSCECWFRPNFAKSFDWIAFNKHFIRGRKGYLIAITIDTCFISKSKKKTEGIRYFWPECAGSIIRGLEILGIALIGTTTNEIFHQRAMQTIATKKRDHKPKYLNHVNNKNSFVVKYLLY